jgi:hypothetical protein
MYTYTHKYIHPVTTKKIEQDKKQSKKKKRRRNKNGATPKSKNAKKAKTTDTAGS